MIDKTTRTRIKICGFTRESDVAEAIDAGVDAIGLVLYEKSARAVTLELATRLAALIPPFVTPVLLFVNPQAELVREALQSIPTALLQFHGDESPLFCEQFSHPYIRAARIPAPNSSSPFHLTHYAQRYESASAILLDTFTPHFGGSGKPFDWTLLPKTIGTNVILSGGLTADNVVQGIAVVKPTCHAFAVDVSSGVETAKGIKDREKMRAFVRAVRSTDDTPPL